MHIEAPLSRTARISNTDNLSLGAVFSNDGVATDKLLIIRGICLFAKIAFRSETKRHVSPVAKNSLNA